MIIVKLIGGLGNQMFQYATAKSLAEKYSTIVKVDISSFESYKLHRYSLHCFQLSEYLASSAEVEAILYGDNTAKKYANRFLSYFNASKIGSNSHVHEKDFRYDNNFVNYPNNIFLEGYWQSEKYFNRIADIIRRDFVVKYIPTKQNADYADLIDSTESVSVHVRRGDYATNKITNSIHGTCDLTYYESAIELIKSKIGRPHLFLFSDDLEWAEKKIRPNLPITSIDCNNASRNYEDLRLMNRCKHNIIANSTFSWWGAWMNSNPNKIVIAPRKWFANGKYTTQDLIPDDWIVM